MDMFVLVRVLLVTCSREPEEQEVRRALAELIKWNPSLQMGIKKLQVSSYSSSSSLQQHI